MTLGGQSARRQIAIAALVFCLVAGERSGGAATSQRDAATINRGLVELETGSSSELSVRMAEEIASIVDDGATRRVLPVIGKGALWNLTDLKYLRGVDLAIVSAGALDYIREQRLMPGIESSLSYVAKLYNEEFHLLARADFKKVEDLAEQTVAVGMPSSSSAVTAARLFDLLNLKVKMVNDEQHIALTKLHRGEIAAIAFVAAKPSPLIQYLKAEAGLHLLSMPLGPAVFGAYPPSQLTAQDYPELIKPDRPADTVAVGTVLMVADLHNVRERYRNVSNFVDVLFTNFGGLLAPGHHPKWREVNLAAELPGWKRHPAAEQWLQRNTQVANASTPDALKQLFSRFIDEHRQAGGNAPMSAAEKDMLFQQFRDWQRGLAR